MNFFKRSKPVEPPVEMVEWEASFEDGQRATYSHPVDVSEESHVPWLRRHIRLVEEIIAEIEVEA